MRVGLLFLDVAAILLGLVGLLAFGAFTASINWQITVENGRLPLFLLVGALMVGMTLAYLVPSLHQRIVRTTFVWHVRLAFVPVSIIWLFLSLSYLRTMGGIEGAFASAVQANYAWVIVAVAALFALLIFPFGLAYGDLRAEARAARQAARRAEADAAGTAFDRSAKHSANAGSMNVHPFGATRSAKVGNAASLILVATCGYAWFFGRTTQSAELDGLLEACAPLAIGGLTLAAWCYMLLTWRAVVARTCEAGQGAARTALGAVLGIPLIAAIAYVAFAFLLLPLAWNALTDNPPGSRAYVVTEVDRKGKGKGCVTMAFEAATDGTTTMCGLGREFSLSLQPGDVLVADGELSRFAHTFESVVVLGR